MCFSKSVRQESIATQPRERYVNDAPGMHAPNFRGPRGNVFFELRRVVHQLLFSMPEPDFSIQRPLVGSTQQPDG